MKKYLFFILFLISMSISNRSHAFNNSMGDTICYGTFVPVMQQVVFFRRQGIMKNQAYSMVESGRNIGGRAFYWFLKTSVNYAYANPDAFENELNNGNWATKCAQALNGF